jgi:hypothetical protein
VGGRFRFVTSAGAVETVVAVGVAAALGVAVVWVVVVARVLAAAGAGLIKLAADAVTAATRARVLGGTARP